MPTAAENAEIFTSIVVQYTTLVKGGHLCNNTHNAP